MSNHTTNDTTHEIPYGYCHCGCGQKTNIAERTTRREGVIKGQPKKFIRGHSMRKRDGYPNPNPSGLCLCGCGQFTPVAKITRFDLGHIKGYPTLYATGHNRLMIPTNEERFWKYTAKRAPNECWEWQGAKGAYGHGVFSIKSRNLFAHRFSYELHKGVIPDGLQVHHSCDNGSCVNPAHLWLGVQADNMRDMVTKGRNNAPGIKLTSAQVIEIRHLCTTSMSQETIAKQFGVAQTTVSKIFLRETWKHI